MKFECQAVKVVPGDKLVALREPHHVKFTDKTAPTVWQVENFKGVSGNPRTILYLEGNMSIHISKSDLVTIDRADTGEENRKRISAAFRSVPCGNARPRDEFMKSCRR